jgi:hypothetical protein
MVPSGYRYLPAYLSLARRTAVGSEQAGRVGSPLVKTDQGDGYHPRPPFVYADGFVQMCVGVPDEAIAAIAARVLQ